MLQYYRGVRWYPPPRWMLDNLIFLLSGPNFVDSYFSKRGIDINWERMSKHLWSWAGPLPSYTQLDFHNLPLDLGVYDQDSYFGLPDEHFLGYFVIQVDGVIRALHPQDRREGYTDELNRRVVELLGVSLQDRATFNTRYKLAMTGLVILLLASSKGRGSNWIIGEYGLNREWGLNFLAGVIYPEELSVESLFEVVATVFPIKEVKATTKLLWEFIFGEEGDAIDSTTQLFGNLGIRFN